MNEVEDEYSGVAKAEPPPPPGKSDGRMYCPLKDFVTRQSNGNLLAESKSHRLRFGRDGSVRVVNEKTHEVEFEK